MDAVLVGSFCEQVQNRGFKKKRALAAAVRLWSGLSEEIQAKLLNQALDRNVFVELVCQIADEQIKEAKKNQ